MPNSLKLREQVKCSNL